MYTADLVLTSIVFISLLISYVFGRKFVTIQRVAPAVAIVVGIVVILNFIPLDATIRLISNIVGLLIALCLVIVFVIIPYLRSSNRLKSIQKHTGKRLKLPSFNTTSHFSAEIVDKKLRYVRGKDSVHFRSKFDGKLTNGFFANQIFTPEHVDGTKVHVDYFESYVPDVSENRRYVTSRCKETLEHMNDNGKLDGNIKLDWKEWSWDIPKYSPLGLYEVRMMVWNTFEDGKKEPFRTVEDTFEVIDPDNSHYQRFNNISIG